MALKKHIRTIAALGLYAMCIPAWSKAPIVAGSYLPGLTLHPSGDYKFEGAPCFLGDGDVGMPNFEESKYVVERGWVVLAGGTEARVIECGLPKRYFILPRPGAVALVPEQVFKELVERWRSGDRSTKVLVTLNNRKVEEIDTGSLRWIPQPYRRLLDAAIPEGKVVSLGAVEHIQRYAAAGRLDGVDGRARAVLDIGTKHGAYKGMRVCAADGVSGGFLAEVSADSSVIFFQWPLQGTFQPAVGMPFSARCARRP